MKRLTVPAVLAVAFLVLTGVLVGRGEYGAGLIAIATAAAFNLAGRALDHAAVRDQYRDDLHGVRMALAVLGDPEALLKRLSAVQERLGKTERLPERLDEVTGKVQKLAGDTSERLVKIENVLQKLTTNEALLRRLTGS